MVRLDSGLPFLHACHHGKTFHEARAAKFAVDDDRQIVLDLSCNDIADCLILNFAQVLFFDLALAISDKGIFQFLRTQQAANLIDAHGRQIV